MTNGRVIIVQYSANLSGSGFSAQLSAKGIDGIGLKTHFVYAFEGPLTKLTDYPVEIIAHKSWLRTHNFGRFFRNLYQEFANKKKFVEFFRSTQPSVVYINTLVSLPAALAARKLNIPVVWHVRELFEDVGGEMKVPFILGKELVRWILSTFAQEIIVISKAVGQNILGEKLLQKVHVMPNAVNADYFNTTLNKEEARTHLNLPTDGLLIGIPGTLRPMKGHSFLIKAAPIILEKFPDCKFVITGGGDDHYKESLIEATQKLNINKHFIFTGSISNMIAFYKSVDAICIPSKAEPFGRTVIEAFACQKPVVATAVGGITEIINDGENGVLVPFDASEKLANALIQILSLPELSEKLGKNARRDAEKHYHEKVYIQRIGTIVKNCL